jgi:16S rRNA (cytosine1402-N4)-methyltransferase
MPSPTVSTVHVPVLLREVLAGLELRPGLVAVDGTFGGGGHGAAILERIGPSGRLIGLDRDPAAIARQADRWAGRPVELRAASYIELPAVLRELGLTRVDRILVDLGLSSDQLADDARGFSFHASGPLDLRFDPHSGMSAADWLMLVGEPELVRVLTEYGEEPAAKKLAAAILSERIKSPIRTAEQLAQLVERVLGAAAAREKHPATRVFQALRIAVNEELRHVEQGVNNVFLDCLAPGGVLGVITFHSLEDRLVKEAFRRSAVWENLTAKPIGPTPAEERVNPRSRSAKLRLARRR